MGGLEELAHGGGCSRVEMSLADCSKATPSLLLGLIGLVFTGELLEHLARWRVFRSVDELFILVPVIVRQT
jgi:solute carrier family 41